MKDNLRRLFHALLAAAACTAAAAAPAALDGWNQANAILARIVPPSFPARDFSIPDFGAVADGHTDCTEAIRRAIAACHAAGGGRVMVPAGTFLTGAIHLLSNVNLHLAAGATLRFSTNLDDYLPVVPTRYEGVECRNYSPFIYALDQENIAVTGEGVLDGQAGYDNWWGWVKAAERARKSRRLAADRDRLLAQGEEGMPPERRVFGPGHVLRPDFIQPYGCKNVLIEGVSIVRSPMWEINPVLCTNVTVRGVRVDSTGPNNDGCDPESCRDVLIEDCTFNTGDDCIAIKSGRNADGRRVGVPAENIIIRRCAMEQGHGGVTIGSEISGGCRNVFVEDCRLNSPDLDSALRIKSNATRGGVMENIFVRNLTVGSVAGAVISVDFGYEEGDSGDFPPVLRHLVVENVTSQSSQRALDLMGIPRSVISDVRLANCTFHDVGAADAAAGVTGLVRTNVRVERGD